MLDFKGYCSRVMTPRPPSRRPIFCTFSSFIYWQEHKNYFKETNTKQEITRSFTSPPPSSLLWYCWAGPGSTSQISWASSSALLWRSCRGIIFGATIAPTLSALGVAPTLGTRHLAVISLNVSEYITYFIDFSCTDPCCICNLYNVFNRIKIIIFIF